VRVQNYVGGRWVASTATDVLPIINPATGDGLGELPLSPGADIDAAVRAAAHAFPEWRATPVVERARVLFRLKALLEEHVDELAELLTTEHGKIRATAASATVALSSARRAAVTVHYREATAASGILPEEVDTSKRIHDPAVQAQGAPILDRVR
jgi:malonate-semialdehyde dehydrogenase (acetylating)/methylmalonate-semialdehyde dehydrogenase